jgi:hypothetical protein
MLPRSLKASNNKVIRKMLVEIDGDGLDDGVRDGEITHTVAGRFLPMIE